MSYVFESKRDLLYHQNYLALRQAFAHTTASEQAIDKVLNEEAAKLLDILARNEIKLNPMHISNEPNMRQALNLI